MANAVLMDSSRFALVLLGGAGVGLTALALRRIARQLRLPEPLVLLVAAATVATIWPRWHVAPGSALQRVVTLALLVILFDGGLHMGRRRARDVIRPILWLGLLGTLLTTAGLAASAHFLIGLHWYPAVLVATALAPTDPAIVFAVLRRRQISGRASTVLEGESGANDPVGIALMIGLLAAGGVSAAAIGKASEHFVTQLVVGVCVGVLGGLLLIYAARHSGAPSTTRYPIRTLALVLMIYAIATVAHGSGFLAVFLAGILAGDEHDYQVEREQTHRALAGVGESVAFVALGLTVRLSHVIHLDVLVPAFALFAVMSLLVRPVLLWPTTAGAGLSRAQRSFVVVAGLKGAVPILLGSLILTAPVSDAERLYSIVVVVVALSVALTGSLLPWLADRLLGVSGGDVEPDERF